MFTDRFVASNKTLSFDHYKAIANCSLSVKEKEDLCDWAEEEKPPREELRQFSLLTGPLTKGKHEIKRLSMVGPHRQYVSDAKKIEQDAPYAPPMMTHAPPSVSFGKKWHL
jgi:hypothetical protein